MPRSRKPEKNRPIDAPDLPKTALEVMRFDPTASEPYELAAIDGAALTDAAVGHLSFDSCILTRMDLDRSKLPNLRLIDARVEKMSAANGEWLKVNLRRVEMTSARMTGLTILEGDLADVLFKDCKLDYLRFASSRMLNVRFENCILSEADFREAHLENVAMIGCDLRNAEFAHARLANIDLRGSRIEGLKIEAGQFPALTIDPVQAMVIVQMLGAKIV